MSDSHLIFDEHGTSDSGKTKRIDVMALDGATLALIRWYGPWRRYVVYPQTGTLFDASCLRELTQYLDKLMLEHKIKSAGLENE